MRLQLAIALLLGTLLIFVSPAGANRTDSGYGMVSPLTTGINVGDAWIVPLSSCSSMACVDYSNANGSAPNDLLLQITATNSAPIVVTLDLSSSYNNNTGDNPDSPFGLIDCVGVSALSNLSGVCQNGNDGSTCNLAGVADMNGTITLPGSCDVKGNTFYFDLSDTSGISVTAGSATMPEPSSLVLLGAALIPVALLARRRQEA